MFCMLPSLNALHLDGNQLNRIGFNLECLDKLKYLNMRDNKISNLDGDKIAELEKIAAKNPSFQIDLRNNPFSCDCDMKPMYKWLLTSKAKILRKEELTCYDGYPQSNAGKKIINIDIDQLQCDERRYDNPVPEEFHY